ncbi:hypothetical protein ACHAWC_004950 [Mediolabrus comicus]
MEPTFLPIVQSIIQLGASKGKWIYDERALAAKLGLSMADFRRFIRMVETEGDGPSPYSAKIDLSSSVRNNIGLYRINHGRKSKKSEDDETTDEVKPSLEASSAEGSIYYQHGASRDAFDRRVTMDLQKELTKMVVGTHPYLGKFGEKYVQERKKTWRAWIMNDDTAEQKVLANLYISNHLPYITTKYIQLWDIPIATAETPTSAELEHVKREIINLMIAMFVIPPTSTSQFTSVRRSTRNSLDNAELRPSTPKRPKYSTEEEVVSDDDDEEEEVDDDDAILSDGTREAIKALNFGSLKRQWDSGDYEDVGRLEIAAYGAHTGATRDSVNQTIAEYSGTTPISAKELEDIKGIGKSKLIRKIDNFKKLREYINSRLPNKLFNVTNDQRILEYVHNGRRYTEAGGSCMTRSLHFISKHNSQRELSLPSAAIIRHAIICFGIPLSKFNGLLNCMSILLTGNVLRKDEFPSTATVRLHMARLSRLDRHLQAEVDKKTFGYTTLNGFPVLQYITTDDTKHGKNDKHHAVIVTGRFSEDNGDDDGNNNVPILEQKPSYIVLASTGAVGSDAAANSDLNHKVMKENIDIKVLSMMGGGTVDGAATAKVEVEETMVKNLAHCEANNMPVDRFGVRPKAIIIPDLFHVDNVAITEASNVFSGEPTKGDSRQFHPKQLLQSTHDLHSNDPEASQGIIDKILAELTETVKYILATCRQRDQRWRVNGLYAARLLAMMDIMVEDPRDESRIVNLLTAWAIHMNLIGGKVVGDDSQWMKQAAEEVAVMSESETIKISLTFEMELVTRFFDITHNSHGKRGEQDRRAGFTTMGLHSLLFNFSIPFWRSASLNPKTAFPQTHGMIEKLGNEEIKRQKLDQLQAAADAGYEKMMKNTELFLLAPLVFLLLTHPVEGPRVLRAMLCCLNGCEEIDLNDVDIYGEADNKPNLDDGTAWGQYKNLSRFTEPEKAWYDVISQDGEDNLLHFWKQFGFQRNCIRNELKRLSRETTPRDESSKTPLKDFAKAYPIIYESLFAAFGFSSSNSRIVEMLHSFVRGCYDSQVPAEFLRDKLRYLMDQEYQLREERRRLYRSRADPKKKWSAAKHLDRKDTQQMGGEQVQKLTSKYHQGVLDVLPPDERKISTYAKKGTTSSEKQKKEAKKAAFISKVAKKTQRRGKDAYLDHDKLVDAAAKAKTVHDREWQNREERLFNEITEDMATVAHFDKCKMANNFFINEVIAVLPYIGVSLDEIQQPPYKTKANIKAKLLSPHIKLIKEIAKGDKPNTITDHDVSGMSKHERLKLFVHADKSLKRKEIEDQIENKRALLKHLFGHVANSISKEYQDLIDAPQAQVDDESWTNDGNEEDDAYDLALGVGMANNDDDQDDDGSSDEEDNNSNNDS